MCAINGITTEDSALVARMNAATRHRGPDGTQVWVGNGVTLGHNRLAIIDLDPRSSQPMHSVDGRYTIVFNGEIYNYRELRTEIGDRYIFTTEGDTEVLLAAYVVWGESMFDKINGIFAFGIWDKEQKELCIARDHRGVKPLYYAFSDGVFSFSSEIPGLLTTLSRRTCDLKSLSLYLAMEYVPGPGTLVSGVTKLRAGECVRVKNGVVTRRSFLKDSYDKRKVEPEEVCATIGVAVQRQLVSERPIGAYLSGGFDSSIVLYHMQQHVPKARTYSVDFESVLGSESDSFKFNMDARLAEQTALFFGAKHTTFTITLRDVRDNLEKIVQSANEPIANATAITQFLLSDFVQKDGTVVVLGGDGGDELFGGYTRHRVLMATYLYQHLPTLVQRLGAIHPRVAKMRTPFGPLFHKAVLVKDAQKIEPFLSRKLSINDDTHTYFKQEYARVMRENVHPLDVFMRVDRETWLPDECFIRSDYASMAHGIELRVPFVDNGVVRLADQISPWEKTLPHEGKRVIRRAYKRYLPHHLYQQPKRGWLSPAAKWFRDPVIGKLAREVYSDGYYDGLRGVFDWNSVQELLQSHINKEGYYLYPLWNILVLQIWARTHRISIHK